MIRESQQTLAPQLLKVALQMNRNPAEKTCPTCKIPAVTKMQKHAKTCKIMQKLAKSPCFDAKSCKTMQNHAKAIVFDAKTP